MSKIMGCVHIYIEREREMYIYVYIYKYTYLEALRTHILRFLGPQPTKGLWAILSLRDTEG